MAAVFAVPEARPAAVFAVPEPRLAARPVPTQFVATEETVAPSKSASEHTAAAPSTEVAMQEFSSGSFVQRCLALVGGTIKKMLPSAVMTFHVNKCESGTGYMLFVTTDANFAQVKVKEGDLLGAMNVFRSHNFVSSSTAMGKCAAPVESATTRPATNVSQMACIMVAAEICSGLRGLGAYNERDLRVLASQLLMPANNTLLRCFVKEVCIPVLSRPFSLHVQITSAYEGLTWRNPHQCNGRGNCRFAVAHGLMIDDVNARMVLVSKVNCVDHGTDEAEASLREMMQVNIPFNQAQCPPAVRNVVAAYARIARDAYAAMARPAV